MSERRSKTVAPTMMDAEQAAELLGLDVYELARELRYAAADALESEARKVRHDEPMELARARRLLRAAEACEKAHDAVVEARMAAS